MKVPFHLPNSNSSQIPLLAPLSAVSPFQHPSPKFCSFCITHSAKESLRMEPDKSQEVNASCYIYTICVLFLQNRIILQEPVFQCIFSLIKRFTVLLSSQSLLL